MSGEQSGSGSIRPRDPVTGRYVKANVEQIIKAIEEESFKPTDEHETAFDAIREALEDGEDAMSKLETAEHMARMQQQISELKIKNLTEERDRLTATWKVKEQELAKEIQEISLLSQKEAFLTSNSIDVKVSPPEEFDGKSENLLNFISQCELVFHGKTKQFESGKARILYALSYMTKGTALPWQQTTVRAQDALIKDLIRQATEGNENLWELFVKEIKRTFLSVSSKIEAQQSLLRMKQGNMTVNEYDTHFLMTAINAELNQETLELLWKQGLKPAIKQKIYESGSMPPTFEDWRIRAKAIDQGWREFRVEHPFQTGKIRAVEQRVYDRPKLSTDEYQRRRKGGLCYKCGNKGHLAKDCFAKARVVKEEAIEEPQDF
jgi:hypothetical protein